MAVAAAAEAQIVELEPQRIDQIGHFLRCRCSVQQARCRQSQLMTAHPQRQSWSRRALEE